MMPIELFDDMQRLQIVVEAVAVLAHPFVQFSFACVPEWRMADVVDQRERFCQIRIQIQRARNGSRDLRHFDRMRQPVAKMIGVARGENLRLRFQTPESARMNHAVAVARIVVAIGMRRLGVAASTRSAHVHCIGGQRHLLILARFPETVKTAS